MLMWLIFLFRNIKVTVIQFLHFEQVVGSGGSAHELHVGRLEGVLQARHVDWILVRGSHRVNAVQRWLAAPIELLVPLDAFLCALHAADSARSAKTVLVLR